MAVSLIEKIARAVFRSNFHPDEDEALVATLWNEWPDDRRDAERAAQAALTAIQDGGDGVQEVDKQAAQELWLDWHIGKHNAEELFSRHRMAAAAAERARIVAWLRTTCYGDPSEARAFAKMIENGETE